MAEQRTCQLVKHLFKTPNLLKTYHQILSEQETTGFIERVDDQPTIHSGIHYIPHQAVEKDSATRPIRIVFDCSCRQSSNHPCLNDCLIIGSLCNNDLCSVQIPFRTHCFGISTDIKKASDYILIIGTTHASSGYPTWQVLQVSFACIVSRSCPSEPLVHHLC